MTEMSKIVEELKGIGITEHDALIIADCIVTRKSCSWVNTDNVDEKMIQDLEDLIRNEDYSISVVVEPIPTRNKFIWEIKVH